jgi:membrane-associated protein
LDEFLLNGKLMEVLHYWFDQFRHLDVFLNQQAHVLGPWLYVVLFGIVFCETGLVVTPFLPGDSLLFAMGALAATSDSPLSLPVLLVLLIVAAVTGDSVNYFLGQRYGVLAFQSEHSRLFIKKHLVRTRDFYAKYGGKTIILARFIPIIRTFAPFVAGMSQMNYRKFWIFNVTGGVAWVTIFLLSGWYFGELEWVKNNFGLITVAIVVISIMPAVVEFVLARRRRVVQAPALAE